MDVKETNIETTLPESDNATNETIGTGHNTTTSKKLTVKRKQLVLLFFFH